MSVGLFARARFAARPAIAKPTRASRRCAASRPASIRRFHAIDSLRNAPAWRRSGCGGYAPVSTPPKSRGTIAIPCGGESQLRRESPFPNNEVVRRRRHGRRESVIVCPSTKNEKERESPLVETFTTRNRRIPRYTASRLIPIVNAVVFN